MGFLSFEDLIPTYQRYYFSTNWSNERVINLSLSIYNAQKMTLLAACTFLSLN